MRKLNLILVILLIIFGASNTIILNLQNIQLTHNGNKFTHPLIQCLLTFLGEIICFFLYLIVKIRPKQSVFQKPKIPVQLICIASIFELVSTALAYIALNMIVSSVWQISRGGVIITTGIFSIIFLHKKIKKQKIIGCALAFLGITLVQIFNVIFSTSKTKAGVSNEIIGFILLLISLIFNGFQFCFQKLLFNKYQLNPLKLVFVEGITSFIIMLLVCIGMQYVPCPWSDTSQCVKVNQDYYMENISVYFNDLLSSMSLIVLSIAQLISISIAIPLAVTITKRISPVSRSIAEVSRTIIVWGFGLIISLTIGQNNSQYIIQDQRWWLNILKLVGFLILILGIATYHDLFQKSNKDSLILSDKSFLSALQPSQQTERISEYLI